MFQITYRYSIITKCFSTNIQRWETRPTTLYNIVHNLLFDFLRAEIKVAVADPLDLKPVPEVIVSTTMEVHLQAIDVLFLEAAARGVCVLVEADAVPQANFQRGLQTSLHRKAHDDSEQHEHSEEARDSEIGL